MQIQKLPSFFKIIRNELLYHEDTPEVHLSLDGVITLCSKSIDGNYWISDSKVKREISNCPYCAIAASKAVYETSR